jgi:xanthine dehydrogenase accessory factor
VSEWLDALVRHRARGERAVLVTVVSAKGSVPRGPGTRMVVVPDAVAGTIGGGHLEFSAIGIARDMLAAVGAPAFEQRRFPLGASLGQCCGGLVNLMFEPVGADASWVETLAALRRKGTAAVVAMAADRATSGRPIVTSGAVVGTFEDDVLDGAVAAAARALLASGEGARIVRLAARGQQEIQVFLDPLRDAGFNVVLFGAGHVGRALVALLASLPCRVTWIDEREAEFPQDIPVNATVVVTDTLDAEVAAAPAGAYFLVMTHSHPLDQAVAEAILKRADFAYFGLIGSLSKRRQFERRMAARGIAPARFADMTCPIGIPGIKGKEPATIAIAVAAELLQIRERAMASAQQTTANGATGEMQA